MKRWAASPNTFTLDFGDYTDEYFSVRTQEGERIAQLIAGYIDIILKRQKPKDHFGIGAEEGCTLEEDEVLPAKYITFFHVESMPWIIIGLKKEIFNTLWFVWLCFCLGFP